MDIRKVSTHPVFLLFLLKKLPLAFVAGVGLLEFDDEKCVTTLKHRWINQNPFRSMYFAAMHMAAELSTGIQLLQYMTEESTFSMLLVSTEANFTKKAVGKIRFHCAEGKSVSAFVSELINKADGDKIDLPVYAQNENGEEVATFKYTWSCKKK